MNEQVPVDIQAADIGFIGCGRVAQTLAQAFAVAGLRVLAVHSRDAGTAIALQARVPSVRVVPHAQQVVDHCKLVFLTVSDDAIEPVCAGLTWTSRHQVVHCSGATEVAALQHAAAAGASIGGFHPLQMFANPDVALASLRGCSVGVEADGALQPLLESLAARIGCVPIVLPAGIRPLYHAGAYYVGPFLIALLQEAVSIWKSFGANEAAILQALVPLLRGTVAAVLDGGLAKGMGGCIARGDLGTVAKHLTAIDQGFPAAGVLYRELSMRNIPLAVERGTLAPERAVAVEALLRQPGAMSAAS